MNKQRNRIFVLGKPNLKSLENFINKDYFKYISDDTKIIPSINNDYSFKFFKDYSHSDIFKECEKIKFENMAILSFYEDKRRDELIEYFITKFAEKKYDTEIFPFLIILKEKYEQFIENKYENLLMKYKDKINVDKCKKKLIIALKENSLESYISKITQIFNGYSNLLIDDKSFQKMMELQEQNEIIYKLKREPYIFKTKAEIFQKLVELIEKKEYNNIIILFDLSVEDSSQIIFDIIKIINGNDLFNDEHPFFIFYTENQEVNKKDIYIKVNNLQKDFINEQKLDVRNISVIHNIENIYSIIIQRHNYFNQIETNINNQFDTSCTINALFAGNSGTGKSTFINRLLGEKRAYVSDKAKTKIYDVYYHKFIPLKLFDSIGFEVGKTEENKDLKNIIKSNESFEKIMEKIHVVYFMLQNEKLNTVQLDFINYVIDKNISIFLIGNKIEKINLKRKSFESAINDYPKFDGNKKNYLINHLYFVDLLAEQCKEIGKIIRHTKQEFLESYNSHKEIIQKFEAFLNEQKEILYKEAAPPVEKDKLINHDDEEDNNKNLIHIDPEMNNNINIKEEKDLRKLNSDFSLLCKSSKFLKENIKEFGDKKKREASKVISEFKTSNFFWGMIPVPILDKKMTKESRLKMINQIFQIYSPVFELIKRQKKEVNKIDQNETEIPRALANGIGDLTLVGGLGIEIASYSGYVINILSKVPRFVIGSLGSVVTLGISLITGYKSSKDVEELGSQIVELLEQEFVKLNAYEIYYDCAKKYNKAINQFEKLAEYFDAQHEIKYDCDIDVKYEDERAPEPIGQL